MTPRIRKQVDELTPEDLNRSSIWEFALDEEGDEGQDEATVRPYESHGPLDPSDGMFVVRARFELADGTRAVGFLTPPVQGDSGLGTLQPAVVVGQGQVSFWCGMLSTDPAHVAASYARLGKSSASEPFPLRFASDVELAGGPVTGELLGVVVLEDFSTMATKIVR
jgi:hypothetical protein